MQFYFVYNNTTKMTTVRHLSNGIVQSEILNSDSTFILVSYYWGKGKVNKGSLYKLTYDEQVDRLIKDCRKHKVNYYFVRYPNLEKGKMYQEALGLKPYFIKKCLKVFPKYKCIFVDTDLRLHKYPHLFEIDADCWFVNWNELDYDCYNPLQLELPGAILGFANTHNARTLLQILIDTLDVRYAEDKTFSGVISRHFLNTFTRCVWLPENYLYLFKNHVYEPGKGYTKIASYKEEFADSEYKASDIVFAHEDFETGALKDVYNEKVGRSRWPPNVDRQLGQKLRCYDIKFNIYLDWGMTLQQQKQYAVDAKMRERSGILKLKSIKTKSSFNMPKIKSIEKKEYSSPFVVVSMVDDNTDKETLKAFVSACKMHRLSYNIYKVKNTRVVNKALFLYKVLRKESKAVVYIDTSIIIKKKPQMFYVKNMDFITVNLNAVFDMSKCYDPRILKTMNDSCMYFANNIITRQFMLIWAEWNSGTYIESGTQHKSLEYAFNVSNALNKMRCYWLSRDYINGSILGNTPASHTYKDTPKRTRVLTRSLEQCGKKKSRSTYSEPYASHKYGSRGRRGINRYGKKFLKFK
jgi:hypothetical protein